MATFEVPLDPTPQTFAITLAGTEYRMTVRWVDAPEGGWTLDIATADTREPLVAGIPLVTGADLLGQYAYLGIGGSLGLFTDGAPDAVPTLDNLGTVTKLYFVTPDEVAA